MTTPTDHLLSTLEKGHLEPEVRVVTNNAGRRPQPTVEELRQRRSAIKRAHDQGHSVEELMAMFDLPRDIVRRDLYSPTDNTPDRVRVRRDKIARLYEQGYQIASEIADKLWPDREITVDDRNMVRADLRALGLDGAFYRALDERRKAVKALHDEGYSFNEVQEKLGITPSQARTDYRAMHLPLAVDLINERREKVRHLRQQGKSPGIIANLLNVSPSVVADDIRRLIAAGLLAPTTVTTVTVKRQRAEERRARIAELYPTGMPIESIAEELDISASTVTNDVSVLKKRGLIRGRTNGSPKLGVPKANATGTNTVSMVENAITHMGQMADVLLGADITAIGGVSAKQWQTWEKALQRVKRAVTYVRRNQPNNEGE